MTLPADFPILFAHARRPDHVRAAIDAFREGLRSGAIRKAEYDSAKSLLGRALERAWREHVGTRFFHAGRWEAQSPQAQELNRSCSPLSLHDLLAIGKRLSKSDCQDLPVLAMRDLTAEIMPLAQASATLKGRVIKGRAPSPEPAPPPNPDQERGTCSCCFRSIAVTPAGRMAHHGYERPGQGYQTSSCAGIRFPPLEVSTEGLEWLLRNTSERLGNLRERLDGKEALTRLNFSVRENGRDVMKTISKGETGWERRLAQWEQATETAIRNTKVVLEDLEARLETWRCAAPSP